MPGRADVDLCACGRLKRDFKPECFACRRKGKPAVCGCCGEPFRRGRGQEDTCGVCLGWMASLPPYYSEESGGDGRPAEARKAAIEKYEARAAASLPLFREAETCTP